MSQGATPSLTTGSDNSPRTILAGNVTTLADVGDVQGNVAEGEHGAILPGEGEVRLADAGAVPQESGPTRGSSNGLSNTDVGRTSVSGDVANVSELAAEAAELAAEEREALAVPSYMASEGSRTDGQVLDDLQDAEAQREAEEAHAIAASGVGSHGDVADVADMADIADDEVQAEAEAADKGASGVASHGDVADIADVADLLEDEAEAEAEETADARSDALPSSNPNPTPTTTPTPTPSPSPDPSPNPNPNPRRPRTSTRASAHRKRCPTFTYPPSSTTSSPVSA